MTKDLFFSQLHWLQIDHIPSPEWYLTNNSQRIRLPSENYPQPNSGTYNYTPITAVCRHLFGKTFKVSQWEEAAKLLGLRADVAKRIMEAYDSSFYWLRRRGNSRATKRMRRCMLETLGLPLY